MMYLEYLIVGILTVALVAIATIYIFYGITLIGWIVLGGMKISKFTTFDRVCVTVASIVTTSVFLFIAYGIGLKILGYS